MRVDEFLNPLPVLCQINLGSLALLFTVRKQIFLKLGDLGRHMWMVDDGGEVTRTEERRVTMSDPLPDPAMVGVFAPMSPHVGAPTRSGIRRLARDEGSNIRGNSARQIAALQRAERDLLITAWTIAQMAVGGLAFCLLIVYLLAREQYFTSSWPVFVQTAPSLPTPRLILSLQTRILLLFHDVGVLLFYSRLQHIRHSQLVFEFGQP